MANSDLAPVLLDRATDDLDMLYGMVRAGIGTDAIFGFHAQQAVEKAAKAWLIARGVVPPWTHDLQLLLTLLADSGVAESDLTEGLARLTAFAVQFRYGPSEPGSVVDRADLVARVARFLQAARAAGGGQA